MLSTTTRVASGQKRVSASSSSAGARQSRKTGRSGSSSAEIRLGRPAGVASETSTSSEQIGRMTPGAQTARASVWSGESSLRPSATIAREGRFEGRASIVSKSSAAVPSS